MLSKVRGHFAQFSGRIVVADFLDVDAHPELTFRSTGVEPAGSWNQALETGGVLVSKKLRIELEIQAVRES